VAGRRSSLKVGTGGRLVSSRSKTGDPQCSAAMSEWVRGRRTGAVAAWVFHTLAMCRAKARALSMSASHAIAGNVAKSQAWAKRAARGLSGAARLREAQRLKGERAVRAKTPKPSLREQAAAHRASQGVEKRAGRILAKISTQKQVHGGHTVEEGQRRIQEWERDAERLGGDRGKAFRAQAESEKKRVARTLEMHRSKHEALERRRERVKAKAGMSPPPKTSAPFHHQVSTAASKVPTSKRYGENKAFVHHVHEAHQANPANPRMSLAEFKRRLPESAEMRARMGRADLVQAMKPSDVAASNVEYKVGGKTVAEFNFIRTSGLAAPAHAKAQGRGTAERAGRARSLVGLRRQLKTVQADLRFHSAEWQKRAHVSDESRRDRLNEEAFVKRQIDKLRSKRRKTA
jgi:hypothetical protein